MIPRHAVHTARKAFVSTAARRHLSGTIDTLPRPLEPWEIQGGLKYAKGATEEEYYVEPEKGGESREDVMGYIARGEAVLIDEDWPDCAKMYAGMVLEVHGEMIKGASTKDCEKRLEKVNQNFLVRYPNPEHFSALEAAAKRGISRIAARSLKIRKIKSFESWCYMNYPPDTTAHIPVAELISLRDSYRRYLTGVRIIRLDPPAMKRGKRNRRAHLPYIYRPLHNVVMPHHSVVNILSERLKAGNKINAKRVTRVLEVGSGTGLSGLLARRHKMGSEQIVLSDPNRNNLLSAKWNNKYLSGRKGFMVVPSKYGLFPSVEDCKGNDFHLILHTIPGTALPVTESVSERCHPGVKQYFLDFLQKADMYLAPNGRIAVTCDNFAALNGQRDFITEVLQGQLSSEHSFEVESYWIEKTEVAGQKRSLANPDGLHMMSVGEARRKKVTGLRVEEEKRELPPGPLRARAKMEEIEAKILGKPVKSWGPAWSPLMNKLGWQETNRLNNQKYFPEPPEDKHKTEQLTDGLRTRMYLLKRKTDSAYRLVDFGQNRIYQDEHDERFDEAAHMLDQDFDGEGSARSWNAQMA